MTNQEIVERVRIMINTGASEDTVHDYITKLYANGKITTNIYDLLVGMNLNRYYIDLYKI